MNGSRMYVVSTPRRGFTIVELLVVMSILVLLMALLLPGLRKAKAQASRVECQARQKQLILAIHLYTGDHFTILPDSKSKFAQWRSEGEFWRIVEYAGGVVDVWDCPRYNYRIWNDDETRYGHGTGKVHQGGLYLAGKQANASYWPSLGDQWFSAKKLTDPGTWEITADRQSKPKSPYFSRVVHGAEGEDLVLFPYGVDPFKIGLVGSNVGALDGSVRWKTAAELEPHKNASNTAYYW